MVSKVGGKMASIVTKIRKNGMRYYITYRLPPKNGKRKQIWVPFGSRTEAKLWLEEVQAAERAGEIFVPPHTGTSNLPTATTYPLNGKTISVQQLLEEFVQHQCRGENPAWSASTLVSSEGIIRNYILPYIGRLNITQITPVTIQCYYDDLPNHKAVQGYLQHRAPKNISTRNVRDVHKILHPAFKFAIRRGYIYYNPTASAELPRLPKYKRKILSIAEALKVISCCEDKQFRLCICLMLGCTLRDSELAGLTWDCVDISNEAVAKNEANILIEKTLRRLDKSALSRVNNRDVIRILPPLKAGTKSVRVLKSTKTDGSCRKVYLPTYVISLLLEHKAIQEQQKELLGEDYHDYGFVIAQSDGNPYLCQTFATKFKKLLAKYNLPSVDFYSLRHASATIKMAATKNIKAVQNDLGHATPDMSVKTYMQIMDEAKKANAAAMDASVFSALGSPNWDP